MQRSRYAEIWSEVEGLAVEYTAEESVFDSLHVYGALRETGMDIRILNNTILTWTILNITRENFKAWVNG